jgi:ArsR family transcriptional regulator
MESRDVIAALAALAHDTRLAIFRRLVQAGPDGVTAGDLASALATAPPTLSFHLNQLATAGLVTSRRVSRYVYYAADYGRMEDVLAYLTENCCGGACTSATAPADASSSSDSAACCGPLLPLGTPVVPHGD